MLHQHGSEYQVKMVRQDGTEELSQWINDEGQIAQAIAALHKPNCKAYWLRQRSLLCAACLDTAQSVTEFPLANVSYPRASPNDSRYMVATGKRNY